MSRKRVFALFLLLAFVILAAVGGWFAGSRIVSPAEAAARTAAPEPSPILVPVERRVLSSDIVTRGTARFGLPQPVAIVPSALKMNAQLITTLPLRNAQFKEGDVLLTASGRPVFILQGDVPAYRDLSPGISGDDVRQLEVALQRLGHDPGPVDGIFDMQTSKAIADWYTSAGWQPFGPTAAQTANIRVLEQDLAAAINKKLAAADAVAAAALGVESASAAADLANRTAAAEVEAKLAAGAKITAPTPGKEHPGLAAARATAELAEKTAAANYAAKMIARKTVALNPLVTQSDRAAADAELEAARAALSSARLEGELSIQMALATHNGATHDARLAAQQLELARSAIEATELQGELAVQAALDAQKAARREAESADKVAARLAADLEMAAAKVGVQVPADEIVFIPSPPVRVEEVTAVVGALASGPVMAVTDNQLSIDSSLRLDEGPLVKPGMPVAIDELALGIKAKGVVKTVATTPGTRGVDGYHFYFEISVAEVENAAPLEGFSLRLTIPIESTGGEVIAVPISALSLAADGTSRIQIQEDKQLKFITVEPGLSADGYVQITPVDGTLEPGQLVVIGYEKE